ncbi:uncharacterized protein TNCV_4108241 [Trichonephila clavipes]|nr:uncharacterized protein TNCV_4108241 [Trichonephila clavipes]
MKNEGPLDIPNFNLVVSYKRPEVPAAGVTIYHNTQDTSHFIISRMGIHTKFTRNIGVNVSDSSDASLWGENWASKLFVTIGIVYIVPQKEVIPALAECNSEANPQVYVETPLHPEKLTVWCALWAGGIIGPYFFKNDEGHNVTVNGDRYRAMITNFFIPELNNHVVQELWFQQDGATCHTARATIDLLKDTFGDRLISRFGPVNWPPRSCDLTPLDYFLWGYVK